MRLAGVDGEAKALVAGVDVGGRAKGYHSVALRERIIVDTHHCREPQGVLNWCLGLGVRVIGIDAPCGWSISGGSRLAERTLQVNGRRIPCFMTPSRERAASSRFYDWVRRGEELYKTLSNHYRLLAEETNLSGVTTTAMPHSDSHGLMFETYPHGIVCSLAGHPVPAHPKLPTRTATLAAAGINAATLRGMDYVDAAICALAAQIVGKSLARTGNSPAPVTERPVKRGFLSFGQHPEGFIVLPCRLEPDFCGITASK